MPSSSNSTRPLLILKKNRNLQGLRFLWEPRPWHTLYVKNIAECLTSISLNFLSLLETARVFVIANHTVSIVCIIGSDIYYKRSLLYDFRLLSLTCVLSDDFMIYLKQLWPARSWCKLRGAKFGTSLTQDV